MKLLNLKLQPNCRFEGKGSQQLMAGSVMTFNISFGTDSYSKVINYKESTPFPMPELTDVVSLVNLTTGETVV